MLECRRFLSVTSIAPNQTGRNSAAVRTSQRSKGLYVDSKESGEKGSGNGCSKGFEYGVDTVSSRQRQGVIAKKESRGEF